MIIARHVTGFYNTLRFYVRYFLIAVYLGIPWIQYNGRQAVLLDMDNRKFYFPGFIIWPQEFYFLMLLVIISGLGLFLFTAWFGRLFCGWGCPQTVYVEMFDDIGRLLFPAHYGKRSEKLWQKIIIHVIWIILSVILVFHFIGYFVPIRGMISDIITQGSEVFFQNSWPYFLVSISALFYADIALFREQMCVYLCPYSRFQSVMMDRDSLVVAYDSKRGEPRKQTRTSIVAAAPLEEDSSKGECTSCNMCTLVCPVGIDIRDGLQVSCINCTHCIDACTREMEKYGRKSLVEYSTITWSEDRKPMRIFRPRTIIYSVLMIVLLGIFSYLMYQRVPTYLGIIRNPLLQPVRYDQYVQNYYDLNIANLSEKPVDYEIKVDLVDGENIIRSVEGLLEQGTVTVEPSQLKRFRFIARATVGDAADSLTTFRDLRIRFTVTDTGNPRNSVHKYSQLTVPAAKK